MRVTMHLVMRNCEGALLRVLGLLERRGHAVLSLVARPSDDARRLSMTVMAETRGPGEIAARQVNRLQDVEEVVVRQEEVR